MTTEIEFSIQASDAELIQPLLAEFEAKYHIQVKLRLLTWDAAWSELVKVALYNDGPDISEVGSTWLGDLTAMGALHAFQPDDITQLGRAARYLPAAWQGCQLTGRPEVWAIPWLVGARLVFFRRDLLLRTGVDEDEAFAGAESFERTLRLLQEHHVPTPWIVPTAHTHTTLLNAASCQLGVGCRRRFHFTPWQACAVRPASGHRRSAQLLCAGALHSARAPADRRAATRYPIPAARRHRRDDRRAMVV